VKIKPILEKVLSIHVAISFWVFPNKEKGWQAWNHSYWKEPKIEILAKKGMVLITLQSSLKKNTSNVKNSTHL
jgi:hypothetical protein